MSPGLLATMALACCAGGSIGAPALPPGGWSLPRRREVRVLTDEDLSRIEAAKAKRARKAARKAGTP